MHARLAFPLLAAVALAGCGRSEAAVTTAAYDTLPGGAVSVSTAEPVGWKAGRYALVETLRIAPPDGEAGELLQPTQLAVDEWGRIYVADRTPSVIKVYERDGRFLRTIGREGEGPGEFRVAFIDVRGGVLMVHDPQVSRTSVFDTSGTFVRSWPSACCYWSQVRIDRDLRLYVPTMGGDSTYARWRHYVRYDVNGTLVDTVRVPPGPVSEEKVWMVRGGSGRNNFSMSTVVPYSPRQLDALHPDGGFVLGWSGEYRLVRSPGGRDTTRLYGRPWTPEPLGDSLKQKTLERMIANFAKQYGEAKVREAFNPGDMPATLPAYRTFAVGQDGATWVFRGAGEDDEEEGTTFDVFAPDGAWRGTVTSPVAIGQWGARWFGADEVVAAIEDEDGRPAVVRLALRPAAPATE